MVRWAGLGSVAVVAVIVVLSRLDAVPMAADIPVGPASAASPARTASPAAPEARPEVRIEHQVIEVPTPAAPAPILRAVAPARSVSARAGREGSAPFVSRARRVLVGDGRYRPEPFPRPASPR